MRAVLRSVLTSLLLAGIIGFTPVAAQISSDTAPQAQQVQDTQWPQPDSVWAVLFEKQMNELLSEPDAHRQDEAMRFIIHFAGVTNQQGEAVFDFRSAAPRLLTIFRTEDDPSRRILALSALHAIGDESSMQTLAEWVPREQSERIRRHAIYVLNAHQK